MKALAIIVGAMWWALLALEGGPLRALPLGLVGTLALVGVVGLHEDDVSPEGDVSPEPSSESDTIGGEEA